MQYSEEKGDRDAFLRYQWRKRAQPVTVSKREGMKGKLTTSRVFTRKVRRRYHGGGRAETTPIISFRGTWSCSHKRRGKKTVLICVGRGSTPGNIGSPEKGGGKNKGKKNGTFCLADRGKEKSGSSPIRACEGEGGETVVRVRFQTLPTNVGGEGEMRRRFLRLLSTMRGEKRIRACLLRLLDDKEEGIGDFLSITILLTNGGGGEKADGFSC